MHRPTFAASGTSYYDDNDHILTLCVGCGRVVVLIFICPHTTKSSTLGFVNASRWIKEALFRLAPNGRTSLSKQQQILYHQFAKLLRSVLAPSNGSYSKIKPHIYLQHTLYLEFSRNKKTPRTVRCRFSSIIFDLFARVFISHTHR